MNKQDEKLYTEIEVQSLIFASQVKHYNEVEKQTEIDHDDLLQENIVLRKQLKKAMKQDDNHYRELARKFKAERDYYKSKCKGE